MARPDFSDNQKVLIYQHFGALCQDCHLKLEGKWHDGGAFNRPKQTFTILNGNIHHIIPVSEGGKHQLENWVLLCVPCHKKRHSEMFVEAYYAER
jgi:5-methylcytosine-specific restriction endonuclease McrA